MNFVGSVNTPGDSIDPEVRKKRGPQDGKSEQDNLTTHCHPEAPSLGAEGSMNFVGGAKYSPAIP
jgi:hypothetical protein